MKQKFLLAILLVLFIITSLTLAGCNSESTVTRTEDESVSTIPANDTFDKVAQIESTLKLIFDGYLCDIYVFEKDGYIDASFFMDCTLSKSNFYDFTEAFTKSVLALSADYGFKVSDISVQFEEQIGNTDESELISWWGDGITGYYMYSPEEILYKDVTLEDLHRICGSSGLHFDIYQ